MCRSWRRTCVMSAVWSVLVAPTIVAAADDVPIQRSHSIQADVYSIIPAAGLSTYRVHGSAAMSGIGTLDHSVAFGERRFAINVTPRFDKGRLIVTVKVEPAETDKLTKAVTQQIDLSEFQCESLELARDADGRVYRLTILPTVSSVQQPKAFRVSDLRMENWSFPACPVILNDEEYVGQLAGGSASLAWFEVLEVGIVEFSLLHLKDAHPWGTLSGGTLTIRREDGTAVKISGVRNGVQQDVLPGGPYTVWVRWKPNTMTADEYRRGMQKNIDLVKEQMANGDTSFSPETLKQLERMSASDRPKMVSNGMRALRPDELEQ